MQQIDTVISSAAPRQVWWTRRGASENARRILPRVPSVKGWVFITLTVDPKRYKDPLAAYLAIVEDFPRFNRALKRKHGDTLRWARKLELQENGWPHWHLIMNLRKLRKSELAWLTRAWSHGRTDLSFIRDDAAFRYVLKYCMKSTSADVGDEYGLPEWVLTLRKRVRWWQTYHFYETPSPARSPRDEVAPPTSEECWDACDPVCPTIRERIKAVRQRVDVVYIEHDTQIVVGRMHFFFDTEALPWLVGLVKDSWTPTSRVPPSLQTQPHIIEIKVSKLCQTTKLPLLPHQPGPVYVSLVA